MPYARDYLKIRDFLLPYATLWQNEVLKLYPTGLAAYSDQWVQELLGLNLKQLWMADGYEDLGPLKDTAIGALFQSVHELELTTRPPEYSSGTLPLPDHAFQHVKPKKRHELSRLAPLLKDWFAEGRYHRLVDVGGGVGHLARVAAHHCSSPGQLKAVCMDADEQLLNSGRKRLPTYPGHEANPVEFVQARFPTEDRLLGQYIDADTLVVGLHTCGPLAVELLRTCSRLGAGAALNFGCCYHKIEDAQALNLSHIAQEKPLGLSPYALTLATRAHHYFDFKDFQFNHRVKTYRYGIHLLLYELGQKEFVAVGEAQNPGLYQRPFGEYAAMKLRELDLWPGRELPDERACQDFFEGAKIQAEIDRLFRMNMVRWRFGPLIERAMLLDRALFMQEQGWQVQLRTFFDTQLSPRNIGLMAWRK